MEYHGARRRFPRWLLDAYLVALAATFFAAGASGIWAGVETIKRPGVPPTVNQQLARLK